MELDLNERAAYTVAHIDQRAYDLSCIEAPAFFLNPFIARAFEDPSQYEAVTSQAPLSVAPRVFDLLADDEPPSLDFFRTLPNPQAGGRSLWAVYSHLMEHPDEHEDPELCPRAYVGVSCDIVSGGVKHRLAQYYRASSNLPSYVELAFDAGYEITATGLLCWIDMPSAVHVPTNEVRLKLLECLFTVYLRASVEKVTDLFVEDFLLWGDQQVG